MNDGELVLAQPLGICAGVKRAILIVERALELFGAPVYVRHEIVHNNYALADLRRKGAVFVDDLSLVPEGATLILSAHGVSRQVHQDVALRRLQVFDATCPLVAKIHVEIAKLAKHGYDILLIGHAGHPEVQGTLGQLPGRIQLVQNVRDVASVVAADPTRVAVVTQTTLSVDETADILKAMRHRFPHLREPKQADICYATTNRQSAVKWLAPSVDVMIVVGSPGSSNSRRLQEAAQRLGTPAYLVDHPGELRAEWFSGRSRVGLTAGASAPDAIVQQVVEGVRAFGIRAVRRMPGPIETTNFPLVRGLRRRGDTVDHGPHATASPPWPIQVEQAGV